MPLRNSCGEVEIHIESAQAALIVLEAELFLVFGQGVIAAASHCCSGFKNIVVRSLFVSLCWDDLQ
jgi:hypothetical protein